MEKTPMQELLNHYNRYRKISIKEAANSTEAPNSAANSVEAPHEPELLRAMEQATNSAPDDLDNALASQALIRRKMSELQSISDTALIELLSDSSGWEGDKYSMAAGMLIAAERLGLTE